MENGPMKSGRAEKVRVRTRVRVRGMIRAGQCGRTTRKNPAMKAGTMPTRSSGA